jgi:hypothetical protein
MPLSFPLVSVSKIPGLGHITSKVSARRLLGAFLCLWLLPVGRVAANPYASGVTNKSGIISWVLNESATDVKIIFDNGKTTNDLGSSPVVGTNAFNAGSHTNFAIVVYKAGSGALAQISSDANVNNNFYGPRGVAVNKNGKTWNFGRIYVSSANPGEAGYGRKTTKGVYVMDAASEDFTGRGATAATAGMSLGTSTTYSPYKLCVGPDDTVYVGDGSASKTGGVWRTDPNLSASTNIFGLANPSTNKTAAGTNFGEVIGTPNVSGSTAGGNLVLTMTAWNLNLINSSGQFGSSAVGYQNIYKYNIGSGPLPWRSFPTVLNNPIGLGTANGVLMDVQIAPDGKYFITADRQSPSDGTTNVCVLDSAGTTVLWDSKSQSAAYFGDAVNDHLCAQNYSIAVSPDDNFVVIQGGANNSFLLMALTNGVPNIATLSTNMKVGTGGGGTCYAAAWDAADNIYVTSGGSDTLEIFSLGLQSTCTTSNDLTCTNGSFHMSFTPVSSLADNAKLGSVSIPAGTHINGRTTFTQTWTMTNTGTTTWTPGSSGYTLNLVGMDTLGAIPYAGNDTGWCVPMATLQGGVSVPPGGVGVFNMMFIAPEAGGSYTDSFQLNNSGSVSFGPRVTVQVNVQQVGSTNQYDRSRAISYANNYDAYVVSDGYFWTDGSTYTLFGTNFVPVPTSVTGDDCAHFVSCCIGTEPHVRGGGMTIPGRVPPTYGEPGAGNLIYTILVAGGYAEEVSSLSQLSPGDIIGWNWEGVTNTSPPTDIDHVTLYVGNGLLASHAVSALDLYAPSWDGSPTVWHLIHIFDAPTLKMAVSGKQLTMSWTTNWAGYVLQSATSLAPANWTNVTTSPTMSGTNYLMSTTMSQQALYYRLIYP